MNYPQYRKYKNNKSYFKIISASAFEEIQVFNNTYTLYFFEAKILPDRNFISDLTFNYEIYCDLIAEHDYQEIKNKVVAIKKKLTL